MAESRDYHHLNSFDIMSCKTKIDMILVGGLEHFFVFPLILGSSSSQLTSPHIFQRGRYTTNQLLSTIDHYYSLLITINHHKSPLVSINHHYSLMGFIHWLTIAGAWHCSLGRRDSRSLGELWWWCRPGPRTEGRFSCVALGSTWDFNRSGIMLLMFVVVHVFNCNV